MIELLKKLAEAHMLLADRNEAWEKSWEELKEYLEHSGQLKGNLESLNFAD